jgi:hypothetical protein
MYVKLQVKKNLFRYRNAGVKGERNYSFYSFLTLALYGVSGQRHSPAEHYSRGKKPGTYWIGAWVGFRAGLDKKGYRKILSLCLGSNPGRPVVKTVVKTLY